LVVSSTVSLEKARLPVLSPEEAWQKLTGSTEGAPPLPVWARALAGRWPLTTARMLELDALHRTGDQLDGRLRAVARWSAAAANRCLYAQALASADYDRAAGYPSNLAERMARPDQLPELERLVAQFARRMMQEADQVTDLEVRRLIELLGEERMVALVALLAHASFQDRVFLALNITPEAAGVPPPVTVRFPRPAAPAPGSASTTTPPSRPTEPPPRPPQPPPSPAWTATRQGLEAQRQRPGRIRVPSVEVVQQRLGPNHPARWQAGIVWSRVCYGYQPVLTDAWFDTVAAFRQESHIDPVFANSVFWTVTNTLNCFY
jgi:hypothetical protein